MQNLREFFASSSGLVPARQGLALGWVISVLTGITVLLGAKEAAADDHQCYEDSWTERLGYSAGCDRRTKGAASYKCQDCRQDVDCNVGCNFAYCCA